MAPDTTHRVVTGTDSRPVLVKRALTAEAATRLAHEADVLGRLAHPATVQVVAATADELHLAWVGPHSLATVTGLPVEDAGRLLARLATVVAEVHHAGVGHGRLTPDHVLLATDGAPVLTGFACAGGLDEVPAADDVAALGALLTTLVAPHDGGPLVPERRRSRTGDGGRRAVLLTLADRATADDPSARPTAADLAQEITVACSSGHRWGRARRPVAVPAPVTASEPSPRPAPTPPPAPVRSVDLGTARHLGPHRTPAPNVRLLTEPHPPSARRRSALGSHPRALAVTALGATVAATFAAAAWIAPSAADPSEAVVPTTTAVPAAVETTTSAASNAPSTPAPSRAPATTTVPAPTTPACAPVSAATTADVDGDGCVEAVVVVGERVTVGEVTWVVGRPGDATLVGDWDCDGTATIASLRVATGEVFVFDRWTDGAEALTVAPVARVDSAERLVAADPDADGCPSLLAERADGQHIVVEAA